MVQRDERRRRRTRVRGWQRRERQSRITINRAHMIDFRLLLRGFEVSRLLGPLRNPLRALVATSESDLSKRSSLDRACGMSHISIMIFTTVTYVYIYTCGRITARNNKHAESFHDVRSRVPTRFPLISARVWSRERPISQICVVEKGNRSRIS
jgi:hypothetical protein